VPFISFFFSPPHCPWKIARFTIFPQMYNSRGCAGVGIHQRHSKIKAILKTNFPRCVLSQTAKKPGGEGARGETRRQLSVEAEASPGGRLLVRLRVGGGWSFCIYLVTFLVGGGEATPAQPGNQATRAEDGLPKRRRSSPAPSLERHRSILISGG